MLNNYQYFLSLAETLNISTAAERLFISHQCLSKYLKNLEKDYGVMLFERRPTFRLTPAGEILLETFKKIEFAEQNGKHLLEDLKNTETGTINLGVTEGRYAIVVPKLLKEFQEIYPHVNINIINTTSPKMETLTLNNELDLFLSGLNYATAKMDYIKIMDEKLYLVISNNLLKKYFPDYPKCKKKFENGADLKLFEQIPCFLNKKKFNSRSVIDRFLTETDGKLNCIAELTQPDMHYRLSAEDMGMSFCLTMYLDGISRINQLKKLQKDKNILNVFPILGLKETNPLGLIFKKGRIFPPYTKKLCKLIKEICVNYSKM